ncbi:SpoIIE family protein phosphatase [Kitasatospora sp. RB6PN24]|uniref:SpoIIE family protein phosphatase n=1 Tax=Kitasatospora humi TaxID=2893891 RepID=UPI001E3FA96B|nr:SpoIIE family protein phosphatase [Kitasatospora humi]MCC9307922.1 SpoIIE family protein phosphatase [Kitasatospora humi]
MAASGSSRQDPDPQGDAYAVVDPAGRLLHWSPGAERLLGHPAAAVLGTAARDLLGAHADPTRLDSDRPGYLGTAALRHRDGSTVEAALWATPLSDGWLLQAAPGDAVRRAQLDRALLDGLFTESPVAIGVFDTDRRFLALNKAGRRAGGFTDVEGRTLREVAPPGLLDLDAFEERQRAVLDSGEPLVRVQVEGAAPAPSRRPLVWSETVLPLRGGSGDLIGLAHVLVDISRQEQARERLRLVNEAGLRIGGGLLDVQHTAQRLADFVVPALCDYAHVDLFHHAFGTGEPDADAVAAGRPLLRAATATAADWWPAHTVPEVGEVDPFASAPGGPAMRALLSRRPLRLTGEGLYSAAVDSGSVRTAAVARDHVHSWLAVPMYVRDMPFGVAVFVRFKEPRSQARRFDLDEVVTAEEIVHRAGIAVDHARSYVRERGRALELQRRLLPSRLPDLLTVDVAYRHLPARGSSALGGAWYDFIRLSGARTALVVGDAAGDGLHAAVYMARFRTATRLLADMDLPPEEVLARLDGHAKRVMVDFAVPGGGPTGTTCLLAVFDPIKHELSLASAGHPPPVVLSADQGARVVDMPIGSPFGMRSAPYESATVPWREGDVLAMSTRGFADADAGDGDGRPEALRAAVASLADPRPAQADLSALCDGMIDRLGTSGMRCDAALMVVRLRRLEPERYASWNLESDPEEVGRARSLVTEQLHAWGLADLDFSTELMVSELVTNALRYGKPPIRLRLIRDQDLICEVADHSSTSPHVRHAAETDEGGRGLYMVAQLADLWGTRYHDRGKTIWARQPLPQAG